MQESNILVYGKRAVEDALNFRPDVVKKVLFADDKKDEKNTRLAREAEIPIGTLSKKDQREDSARQGVAAVISLPHLIVPFETFLNNLPLESNPGLAILGEVQYQHNLGAIIRSATAFGLSGVLFPKHNQASISDLVIRTSVGTAFQIPLIEVGNVNQAIEKLKKKGFWVYGLSGEAKQDINTEKFSKPAAFVVGNESTGIREKTEEHCDLMLKIPIDPRCESLNASVSAAVAFFVWQSNHQTF